MKIGWIIGLGVLASSLNLSIAARVFADGGDTTLIHGCINNNAKATRIVGANANCQNNETSRHWPTAARIVADETRITNTENKNTTQDSAISAIQTKNTQQDAAIAALQGQGGGGGASAVVVKDSLGQIVGRLVDQNTVFLKIGNVPISFFVNPVGFFPEPFNFITRQLTALAPAIWCPPGVLVALQKYQVASTDKPCTIRRSLRRHY